MDTFLLGFPTYQGQHLRFRRLVSVCKDKVSHSHHGYGMPNSGEDKGKVDPKRYFSPLGGVVGFGCGWVFWISSPQRQAVEVFESGVHEYVFSIVKSIFLSTYATVYIPFHFTHNW